MRTPTVIAAALLLCCSAPAAAQSVKLEFKNGKVDLSAQSATVRSILTEWGRLGRTQIVNGDRVPGPPVTLELVGVYEREALEILLRGVSGYLVNPRESGTTGASGFDRILILPTSNAPRPPTAPAGGVNPRAVPPPSRPPVFQPPDEDDGGEDPPPVPIENGRAGPAPNPRATAIRERLGQILELDPDSVDPQPEVQPASAPGNPFTATPGSDRPGVIVSPPQPVRPRPQPQDVQER